MIPRKPNFIKSGFFVVVLTIVSFINSSAQDGKALFNSKCASCHQIFKDAVGPALMNLEERGKWADHNEILKWANNPTAYMAKDPYTEGLKAKFGSVMQAFPDLTIKDVDAIVGYIDQQVADKNKAPQTPTGETTAPDNGHNAVIFGVISLILAIIALILMQVNSNLKKLSDDAENILRPDPVPFYRNKVYIALLAFILFVVGGYYLTKGAINLGRQKNYEPAQPIFYSHKVHAGINQINCLYCHGSAWDSKTAGVPSVNICMNCHKAITEYTKGPKLFNEEQQEINGTAEIAKLFKAAGFDPSKPNAWDPSKAKPLEWIKIHNLPDHVFFSHAQHVRAGKVQCQTCHGEITAMDEVKQFSELSMGWCINCHRETKVDFNYSDSTGNKFYSIYEKFHNDIKAGKMDSVTVKDIGGLECQKCHY
ncbi:MAG: c-type cytochrome [Bacteroidetes bacterium]|nr:c-type cytochrome [Bacteroidota bacterium]MBS1608406.1 c-type cytochrome [Bacteroidota bacterium]